MTTLYDLSDQYIDCLNQLEDEELELTEEEIERILQPISDDFEKKATNIAKHIKNMQADVEALKAEEDRLAVRRRAFENKIKWLKSYLLSGMEKYADNLKDGKIKNELFTIYAQNNPPKVDIEEEKDVPEEFMRIIKEPDVGLIKDYLKEHGNQKWAKLVVGRSLRIR